MPIKGHTSIIMLMYAPCWLQPLKPVVNGRLRHVPVSCLLLLLVKRKNANRRKHETLLLSATSKRYH